MTSNKWTQDPVHRETLNHVLISLEDTKLWDRDVSRKSIIYVMDRKGARKYSLKLFSFLHPLYTIILFFIGYLIAAYFAINFFFMALKFSHIGDSPLLRLTFFFLILLPYICYSLKLINMTPKSPVGYDERWSTTLTRFLSNSKITETHDHHQILKQYQEAKRRPNKSIRYYQREGEIIKFFMTIIGSGILMGTLASKEFQVALCTFSATKIIDANPLGLICFIVSPLILIFYLKRYYLPIAWMQQIVDQIELLDKQS